MDSGKFAFLGNLPFPVHFPFLKRFLEVHNLETKPTVPTFHPVQAGLSLTSFPGLLHVRCTQVLSPAVPPARLCSCFSSLPQEGRGRFRPAVCCPLGYLVQSATHLNAPGHEDTSQLPAVQSSDQSRVPTHDSSKPNSSASAPLFLEGVCWDELLEALIRLLQKLFSLKTDPVFVALILHSGKDAPLLGERGAAGIPGDPGASRRCSGDSYT